MEGYKFIQETYLHTYLVSQTICGESAVFQTLVTFFCPLQNIHTYREKTEYSYTISLLLKSSGAELSCDGFKAARDSCCTLHIRALKVVYVYDALASYLAQ